MAKSSLNQHDHVALPYMTLATPIINLLHQTYPTIISFHSLTKLQMNTIFLQTLFITGDFLGGAKN